MVKNQKIKDGVFIAKWNKREIKRFENVIEIAISNSKGVLVYRFYRDEPHQ